MRRPKFLRALRRCAALALGVVAFPHAAWPAGGAPPRSFLAVPGDSLAAWATEARGRFHSNAGDSVGGANYRAYELVGQMSRRLLRSLGPGGLLQAHGVKPQLDSLGLDADVVVDPTESAFALVMVRNPYRFSAQSVGFLYWWYRGEDLRMQGAVFRGAMEPVMRVWWTGRPERPYEWAVVEHGRGNGPAHFTLFRLSPSGSFWVIGQSEEDSPLLGEPGEAVFADLNHDGEPELIQWAIPRTDSLFIPFSFCPRPPTEKTFVERGEGFVLEDSRVVPSPYAALVTFVRLLIDNRRVEAEKLVRDPAMVTQALAAGWGARRRAGTWQVEYGEEGARWPRWLEVRFDGPQGVKRYVVRFGQRDTRWIIQQWVEPQPAPARRMDRPVAPKSGMDTR